MAISDNTREVVAQGDGTQTAFSFNHLHYDLSHLVIYKDKVKQTTGFTQVGTLDTETDGYKSSTFTFDNAPAQGTEIRIRRVVPRTQPIVYKRSGPFPTKSHEKGLDWLTQLVGELDDERDQHTATSAVTTSAKTILADLGVEGSISYVIGKDTSGNNRFMDVVIGSQHVAPSVLHSFTVQGSPTARTYTRSTNALQLAMASGTYDIVVRNAVVRKPV